MHISEFDYDLPPELIAQHPLTERDRSRMLVVNRAAGTWRDGGFAELPTLLAAGDALVLNNTRVFPARLIGHRITGGERGAKVEALLLRRISVEPNEWEVLARPGRALRAGAALEFGDGRLRATVVAQLEEGRRLIRFERAENFDQLIDEIGNTPLPPYIRRDAESAGAARLDEPEYQTIYASRRGAIAAPTAGLHFTGRTFAELRARGIRVVEITHHVGFATFQPVRVEQIEEHHIEAESFEISAAAAATINAAKESGRRVVAVGTTTTRALESAADEAGIVRAGRATTELFIYPGHRFRVPDGLVTNFHLPQSSLLMLVSAFAGRELILNAYRHAVTSGYRFYSYGDCMFIS
ncbi:MAG TPA: tRNA preQ1(34) S-adenosylmethionine ribosyltransferase-isomerase QueA [Blastocatellia bacterium]|nr:tRNA preQ1(34) S-adenosylmethionine ribosyltransferase-isomerase QueA [Blastocatellia bacterium]